MTDVRDASFVAKASDGRLIRRPLSPHIGIYRWPVTMASSILNRATGIVLCAGTLLLVWWLAAAAAGPASFDLVQEFCKSPLGLLVLFGWTASLFFHLLSGLRHLAWDMGYGFAKPGLNRGTWLLFGATILCTVVIWVTAYSQLGG
ncbi:MAG TPA: succinate dehydrogenase, cytochrome b556 subunit [Acetobacteraceae bacterium]|nr:succinate dehydrogenase, cytochrome b556 subunit [Acetobacteraceae bacterium]